MYSDDPRGCVPWTCPLPWHFAARQPRRGPPGQSLTHRVAGIGLATASLAGVAGVAFGPGDEDLEAMVSERT